VIYTKETNAMSCSLTEVLQAARDAKDKCDRGRSTFRAKMEALLLIFSEYCVTIDIMVEHQPHITALVWGAIRFLISV